MLELPLECTPASRPQSQTQGAAIFPDPQSAKVQRSNTEWPALTAVPTQPQLMNGPRDGLTWPCRTLIRMRLRQCLQRWLGLWSPQS